MAQLVKPPTLDLSSGLGGKKRYIKPLENNREDHLQDLKVGKTSGA